MHDIDAAEALAGRKIWIDAADVPLEAGEYLWADLVGCTVIEAAGGRVLGDVVAVEEYGAQDTLVVQTPDDANRPGEWMLPFVEDVIVGVDLDARRITVDMPEGMEACFTPKS